MASLPAGQMLDVEVNDDLRIAVCNVDGQIHAIDGICPHRDAPLAQGALHGRMVVCPWHAWEFDCTTGEHDYNPGVRLRCFPVKVEDGDILVDHPDFV